jgi:hypothetical protein
MPLRGCAVIRRQSTHERTRRYLSYLRLPSRLYSFSSTLRASSSIGYSTRHTLIPLLSNRATYFLPSLFSADLRKHFKLLNTLSLSGFAQDTRKLCLTLRVLHG